MFALRCKWKRIQVSQKVTIIFFHFEPKQKDATVFNVKFHEYSTSDLGFGNMHTLQVGEVTIFNDL